MKIDDKAAAKYATRPYRNACQRGPCVTARKFATDFAVDRAELIETLEQLLLCMPRQCDEVCYERKRRAEDLVNFARGIR